MFKKQYGLFYKNGRWYVRDYCRVLKKGGMTWGNAKILAWWKNQKGEIPPIVANLKKKRGAPDFKTGYLVAFRESSPFIKTSWDEPRR